MNTIKTILLCSIVAVAALSCNKDKECPSSTEQSFALENFSRIAAGENFQVTIRKGTTYSVKASGCSRDLSELELSIGNGQLLEAKYSRYRSSRYRVYLDITLPVLSSVQLSGASRATDNGFADQPSSIRAALSGVAECTLNGTGINTYLDLSGESKLNVSGNTESLSGNMSGASQLNSYGLTSNEVDLTTSGLSKAYVAPLNALYASASGDSRVYYKGNPPLTSIQMSGTAKVIRQP